MKCRYCGKQSRSVIICSHCGRMLITVRADAAQRQRARRRHRQRVLHRVCVIAVILLVITAAILAGVVIRDIIRDGSAPHTAAETVDPEQTAEPEHTPEPEPTELLTILPTATSEAFVPLTQAPFEAATASPYSTQPTTVATKADLIELYWWMIYSGNTQARLDSVTLDAGTIADVTDKFSNYFTGYRYDADSTSFTVAFKAGLQALHALKSGDLAGLDADVRTVAESAQRVVAELIRPDMTDWDKELALHDYIVGECEYLVDAGSVPVGDARGFFLYGECQCAGYVDTFRLLGRLAGLDVEMIGGQTTRDDPDVKGHAWSLIRLDGLWYTVDLTWDDRIGVSEVEHTFYNLPQSAYGASRSYDAAYMPPGERAAAVDANYYYAHMDYAADSTDSAVQTAAAQLSDGGDAYVYFTETAAPDDVARELTARFNADVGYEELSADLTIDVYRFYIR